ncbi:MAG TPA: hypothetical protein VF484_04515 [Candidatus Limnocylindrales bacterium]
MLGIYPLWVWAVVLAVAVASRPIETRLWQRGRLSNRGLAFLVAARTPLIVLFGAIAFRTELPIALALVALSALPGAILFRFVREQIDEEGRARGRTQSSHV